MLEEKRWLSEAEALAWIKERCDLTEPPGQLDVDPLVVASGYGRSGAGVYAPRRGSSLLFDEARGGVIIDGSLVSDGLVVNRGVTFVNGNLVCRGLFNSGYLVVAGHLVCERFFGENETGGSLLLGDAEGQAVVLHVHQYSVWGTSRLELVDDEADGRAAAHARLRQWGLLLEGEEPYPWPEMIARFRAWAEAQPPLPEAWVARPFTPRLPEVAAPPPAKPELPPLLQQLAGWLAAAEPPQRAKLDELRATWLARLRTLPLAERQQGRRLIAKHIVSKKLVEARDALMAELVA